MSRGRAAIGLAVLHTLVLAACTLPADLVPERARHWAQVYAGLLFHQDWRLFAPDPPACGCSLQVTVAGKPPLVLAEQHDHFIWRRMSANACRFVEASMADGQGRVPVVLTRSVERMVQADTAIQVRWRRSGACKGSTTVPINAH